MRPVLTPEQCRTLDRVTQELGTSAATLMDRAGRAVARACLEVLGGAYGRRAVVVCGPGNNGGDGSVVARELSRAGVRVTVLLVEPSRPPEGAAAEHFTELAHHDVRVQDWSLQAGARALRRTDLVVDAILGTGFRGRVEGGYAAAIRAIDDAPAPVVAVDIPSGVDGLTGGADLAVAADLTITFGAEKPGLVLLPGALLAGIVEVADIGFAPEGRRPDLHVLERDDVAVAWPVRSPDSHKRGNGVVLVVAGSRDLTGAPQLVARAAARAGAGLVQVAAPESALPAIQSALAGATFVGLPETDAGTVAHGAADVLKEPLARADALAIGPGLGRNPETDTAIRELIGTNHLPVVVDADALNAFEGRVGSLGTAGKGSVLTPHAGEAERLLQVPASEIVADIITSARQLARRADSVTLLKGSRTVVAEPGGAARINETGTAALATGGTGDVLTGVIAALLARKVRPLDAAGAAAYVHGVAGATVAERFGDGTTADDVCDALPSAIDDVVSGVW